MARASCYTLRFWLDHYNDLQLTNITHLLALQVGAAIATSLEQDGLGKALRLAYPLQRLVLGNMAHVTDALFGTKYFTQGADLQLPRKVPLRIEPKSYFGTVALRAGLDSLDHTSFHVFAVCWLDYSDLTLFAANERTFLAWMHMAITMGGITTALASFSVESENEATHKPGSGPVTRRTTQAIVMMLLPISIGMIAYALFTFYWRSRCMERKQVSHTLFALLGCWPSCY